MNKVSSIVGACITSDGHGWGSIVYLNDKKFKVSGTSIHTEKGACIVSGVIHIIRRINTMLKNKGQIRFYTNSHDLLEHLNEWQDLQEEIEESQHEISFYYIPDSSDMKKAHSFAEEACKIYQTEWIGQRAPDYDNNRYCWDIETYYPRFNIRDTEHIGVEKICFNFIPLSEFINGLAGF